MKRHGESFLIMLFVCVCAAKDRDKGPLHVGIAYPTTLTRTTRRTHTGSCCWFGKCSGTSSFTCIWRECTLFKPAEMVAGWPMSTHHTHSQAVPFSARMDKVRPYSCLTLASWMLASCSFLVYERVAHSFNHSHTAIVIGTARVRGSSTIACVFLQDIVIVVVVAV